MTILVSKIVLGNDSCGKYPVVLEGDSPAKNEIIVCLGNPQNMRHDRPGTVGFTSSLENPHRRSSNKGVHTYEGKAKEGIYCIEGDH